MSRNKGNGADTPLQSQIDQLTELVARLNNQVARLSEVVAGPKRDHNITEPPVGGTRPIVNVNKIENVKGLLKQVPAYNIAIAGAVLRLDDGIPGEPTTNAVSGSYDGTTVGYNFNGRQLPDAVVGTDNRLIVWVRYALNAVPPLTWTPYYVTTREFRGT